MNLENSFIERLQVHRNPAAPFAAVRDSAWQRLCEAQPWKLPFLPLRALSALPLEKGAAPTLDLLPSNRQKGHLVFVNGQFQPECSDSELLKGVEVVPLEQPDPFEEFVEQLLTQQQQAEKNPLAFLSQALWQSGVFLYLPPKTVLTQPIQILHFVVGQATIVAAPLLLIHLGKKAQATIHWQTVSLTQTHSLLAPLFHLSIDEEAHCTLRSLHEGVTTPWSIETVRSTLKRQSRLQIATHVRKSCCQIQDWKATLLGSDAEVELSGLATLTGGEQCHTQITVEHIAPSCHSSQLFKNVLEENSKSSFSGKIFIDREAQKTESMQRNNNLLLSPFAIANSQPELRIFADDVKASHGATVGQLDLEELFYLTSRGFSKKEAQELLLKGFCREVLERLE